MKSFSLAGETLIALPSGGLYWPDQSLLVVSDLHLGKSERIARRSGQMLPPYETTETLTKMHRDLDDTQAQNVICLGDSFDDLQAGTAILEETGARLAGMMAGRDWIWIEGNHDPGPLEFGGSHMVRVAKDPLLFQHEAKEHGPRGEVTGHFHPKARIILRGREITRRCFLYDDHRLILPAYGTYTGGLRSEAEVLQKLMARNARAILIGQSCVEVPMPRSD